MRVSVRFLQVYMLLQGYFVYDNTTTATRPVVVIAPDYDGIGPYELWRANQLATLGYAGKPCCIEQRW